MRCMCHRQGKGLSNQQQLTRRVSGEYLPSLKPRNIEELFGEEAGLNLLGANGGPIPFDGWVEVQFQLTSGAQSSTPLIVPLLVTRDDWNIQSLVIMS